MNAWIPYGCYWSTPFAKWQGSFAHLHAMKFAADVTKAEMRKRSMSSLARMNNFGCSLIYGHPQAPMGLRGIMELIEELAQKGGGRGLFSRCAAGDTAMALVIQVGDS